ncbi:MAG: hypothetical protein RMJ05_06970 [Thermomicrobium sp.]|nr:hypothetical protein [Thermomicrobium sp.]MDW8060007.1 hypothetical protein [Thermomicrobium sp.]
MTLIACPSCGATIGERVQDAVLIRHRQRLILVSLAGLRALSCWRCGAVHEGQRVRELVDAMAVDGRQIDAR